MDNWSTIRGHKYDPQLVVPVLNKYSFLSQTIYHEFLQGNSVPSDLEFQYLDYWVIEWKQFEMESTVSIIVSNTYLLKLV